MDFWMPFSINSTIDATTNAPCQRQRTLGPVAMNVSTTREPLPTECRSYQSQKREWPDRPSRIIRKTHPQPLTESAVFLNRAIFSNVAFRVGTCVIAGKFRRWKVFVARLTAALFCLFCNWKRKKLPQLTKQWGSCAIFSLITSIFECVTKYVIWQSLAVRFVTRLRFLIRKHNIASSIVSFCDDKIACRISNVRDFLFITKQLRHSENFQWTSASEWTAKNIKHIYFRARNLHSFRKFINVDGSAAVFLHRSPA